MEKTCGYRDSSRCLALIGGIAFALIHFLSQANEDVGEPVVEEVALAEEGDSYRDDDGTLYITDDVKQVMDVPF